MLTSMTRVTVRQMAWAVRSQGMPWVVGVLVAIAAEEGESMGPPVCEHPRCEVLNRRKKEAWEVVERILSDAATEIRDMLGDVP